LGKAGKDPTGAAGGGSDEGWRRGHRYGIWVDLERSQVVGLLPNRQAATLVAWLREHTGVEICHMRRAGAYAEGIRKGTPDAVRFADR
jgi:transposase